MPVGCDAAMLALKNTFDPGVAADFDAVVEVRFGAGTFAVTVGDGHLDIQRGAADHPGAVIVTDPVTLEEVAFGMRTLDGAESAGDLRGRR